MQRRVWAVGLIVVACLAADGPPATGLASRPVEDIASHLTEGRWRYDAHQKAFDTIETYSFAADGRYVVEITADYQVSERGSWKVSGEAGGGVTLSISGRVTGVLCEGCKLEYLAVSDAIRVHHPQVDGTIELTHLKD